MDVSSTIRSWNRQASCTVGLVQSWPANSPGLSPIENLWSYVDRQVLAIGCKTFADFRAAVHAEWGKVSSAVARQYTSSMPTRLANWIDDHGKMTKYWQAPMSRFQWQCPFSIPSGGIYMERLQWHGH